MNIVYPGSFYAERFENLLSLNANIFWQAGEKIN